MRTGLMSAIAMSTLVSVGGLWNAFAANDRIRFPEDYATGVHYASVDRGGIRKELFANRDAIEAAKAGQPLPDGTVITMEDYRNGQLFRYVVMEKHAGWGNQYPEDVRNADWEYREFRPDRTPNGSESGRACMTCHIGQSSNDFVWTYNRMKTAE